MRSGAPHALPHANRGEVLYRLGWFRELHLQQAVEEFRRALGLDKKSLRARNGLGVCLLKLGDSAGAAVEFLRAAEQAPDDPDLRYNYAVACARQARTDRARTELAQLLDDHPTHEPARRALDLKYVSREAFFEFYRVYTEGEAAEERRKKAKNKPGGDFYNNQNTRVGERFATEIVRAAKEGRLLYSDAYKLTGLHGETFARYTRHLGFDV